MKPIDEKAAQAKVYIRRGKVGDSSVIVLGAAEIRTSLQCHHIVNGLISSVRGLQSRRGAWTLRQPSKFARPGVHTDRVGSVRRSSAGRAQISLEEIMTSSADKMKRGKRGTHRTGWRTSLRWRLPSRGVGGRRLRRAWARSHGWLLERGVRASAFYFSASWYLARCCLSLRAGGAARGQPSAFSAACRQKTSKRGWGREAYRLVRRDSPPAAYVPTCKEGGMGKGGGVTGGDICLVLKIMIASRPGGGGSRNSGSPAKHLRCHCHVLISAKWSTVLRNFLHRQNDIMQSN